jgi:hypothetical protein
MGAVYQKFLLESRRNESNLNWPVRSQGYCRSRQPSFFYFSIKFTNGHCPVERPKPTTSIPTEPLKVFLKFHKKTGMDMEVLERLVPSKQEEALFCYK